MQKILWVVALALVIPLSGCGYKNIEKEPPQKTSPEEVPVLNARQELCNRINHTDPTAEEVKYNQEIAKDEFAGYLRRALDNFLGEKYINCGGGDDCNNRGLFDNKQYPDSAYQDLQKINREYLSSKFIVLETDIALGGGESVVLLFKDKPDKLFCAWVYDYKNNRGYDLRTFEKCNKGYEIEKVQKTYINQLCNDEIGI